MKIWSCSIPLFLSLVWPSKDPTMVAIGWTILLLLVVKRKDLLALRRWTGLAMTLFVLCAVSLVHIFYSGSWAELGDLVRIIPIAAALCFARTATIEGLYSTFFCVGILNVASLPLIEQGYFADVFALLHARTLSESYGRHSGLFLNVSTLGIFSVGWLLLAMALFFKNGFKTHIALTAILSTVLLVASGGKTQVVALGCVVSVWVLSTLIRGRPILAAVLLAPILTPLVLHAGGVIYVHQITKLYNVIEYGSSAVSSVQGRLDLWQDFFRIWLNDPLWTIFGAPKLMLDAVGNTYDSDLIWLILRYGVLASFGYVAFLSFVLFRGSMKRSPLLPLTAALIVMGFSIGVMTAFQMSFFYWVVLLTTLQTPTPWQVKADRKRKYVFAH